MWTEKTLPSDIQTRLERTRIRVINLTFRSTRCGITSSNKSGAVRGRILKFQLVIKNKSILLQWS